MQPNLRILAILLYCCYHSLFSRWFGILFHLILIRCFVSVQFVLFSWLQCLLCSQKNPPQFVASQQSEVVMSFCYQLLISGFWRYTVFEKNSPRSCFCYNLFGLLNRFWWYLAEMLAKDFEHLLYCNYVNCFVSGLTWFSTDVIFAWVWHFPLWIGQNWMLMLQAVVNIHRTVVKGSAVHILLIAWFSCMFV